MCNGELKSTIFRIIDSMLDEWTTVDIEDVPVFINGYVRFILESVTDGE